mgnify:CR=1 FL=1
MKGIMREIRSDNALSDRLRDEDDQLRRQVAALYALLANIYEIGRASCRERV